MKDWQTIALGFGAVAWLSWLIEHCADHIMGGLRELARRIDLLENSVRDKLDDN
jgi:hypothetical protein